MMREIRSLLGKEVDNSPLVFFRMCFGFLAAAESFGAIFTGWVNATFMEPTFTFTFIGFEWMQALPGDGMIYYFIVMGVAALMIMSGFYYRLSSFIFFIMWSAVYLMQKSHYNNHYYLLMLMSGVMIFMPAHKNYSLDAKLGKTVPSTTSPQACHWFFIIQVMIVYVFASLNKMHMDWLMARPIALWFQMKSHYWLIGPLLTEKWVQYTIAWGGILYDGTIVFLLLYSRTRKMAFILSLFFNLCNSVIFQIGIFPYLMIALTVFFFPPGTIRHLFFKKKESIIPAKGTLSIAWTWLFTGYFIIQLLLPLRPLLFKGDAHFTEEGHRLSWRMMLRAKSSSLKIDVVDKETGERSSVTLSDYVTPDQRDAMSGHPDMIWQFAQRIKKEFSEKGKQVAVYADARVSLNGHPEKKLTDSTVDLAGVSWERWKHSDWILTPN